MRGSWTIKNMNLDNSQGKGLCGGDMQISVKTYPPLKFRKVQNLSSKKKLNKINKNHDR
jgi:hypothetical protein